MAIYIYNLKTPIVNTSCKVFLDYKIHYTLHIEIKQFLCNELCTSVIIISAWQELFLPIIELKNYTKYVVVYLSNLLDSRGAMDAKVSQDQLFAMFDMVNNKRHSLSKELSSDLINQLSKYKVS